MPITFENLNFEKYLDYAINYSLLFVMYKGKYIKPNGQTFKDFMEGNFLPLKGIKATIEDFETHLATIFTEVRLKQFIEIRSIDTCDWGCICNGPAFFTGLLYGALDETYEVIKSWTKNEVMEAYLKSPKQGLDTELKGRKLHDWGKIFLDLAKKGLIQRKRINSKGNDETVYLKHVQNVVKNKKNRAQLLLEQYDKTQNLDFFNNEKENFSYSGF